MVFWVAALKPAKDSPDGVFGKDADKSGLESLLIGTKMPAPGTEVAKYETLEQ